MTISSHRKGSEEGYIRKENAKVKSIEKMSDEEYDTQMTELKVHFALLKEMFWQNLDDQYYGLVLKEKKIKWLVKRLFDRKLKHKVNVWLKTLQTRGKFRETKSGLLKEEVYLCKPEKGYFVR